MYYFGKEPHKTARIHYCPEMVLSAFRAKDGSFLVWNKSDKKKVKGRMQDLSVHPFIWFSDDDEEEPYIPKECFLELAFPGIKLSHLLSEDNTVPTFFHRLFLFLNTLSSVEYRYPKIDWGDCSVVFRRKEAAVTRDPSYLEELYTNADKNIDEAFEYVDLKSAVLHAPSSSSFILSDNPVIQMNPWYIKQNCRLESCHRDIGYMALYPITPSDCLVLYDGSTYRLTGNVLSEEDMDYINTMSSIQGVNFIYTENFDLEKYIYVRQLRTENLYLYAQRELSPSYPSAYLSVLPAYRRNNSRLSDSKHRPTYLDRESGVDYYLWWFDEDEEELKKDRQECWKKLEKEASKIYTLPPA